MTRQFLVSVTTDEGPQDTLDAQTLMNEIQQNLEYEAHQYGITEVMVRAVSPKDGD